MRLRALLLDRYGPFTDRRLDFRDDVALTVVHGRNEAGKTSALRAIEDALFGFEQRTRMAFEHDSDTLRVGAELAAADGRRVTFHRRKGNKRTLLDPAGEPLADDALASFVGAVDRALFLEAFGLNRERLEKGGKALATGEGTIGEALLAAAPGLGRLTELRRTLREEADSLFTARRSAGKPFYKTLETWDAAHRAGRERTLGEGRIREADEDVARALAIRNEAVARRRALLEADAATTRRLAILPRLATIDDLAATIAGIPDRPGVDEAFEADLRAASQRLRDAERDLERIGRELPDLERRRAATAPDRRCLDRAADVDAVVARAAKRETDAADRDGTAARLADADRRLDEIAAALGLADGLAVRGARPDAASIARAKAVASDQRRRLADRDAALAAREDARHRFAEAERSIADIGAPADPRDARARLAAVQGLAGLEKQARTTRAEAATAQEKLSAALSAAGLDPGGPASLRSRRLPAAPDLSAAADRRSDLSRALEAAEARRRLLADRAAETRAKAETLAGGPTPDPADLADARRRRDDALGRLRAGSFAVPPPSPAEYAALYGVMDRAIAETDRLADLLIADSTRAAEIEAARRTATEAEDALRTATVAEEAARTALSDFDAAFAASLSATDLRAATPAAAAALLEEHDRLVAHLDRADVAARVAVDAEAERDAVTASLRRLADDLGIAADLADGLAVLAVVRARIEAAETAWDSARGLQAVRGEAERRRDDAERVIAVVEARLADAAGALSDAASAIGLGPGAGLAELEAALEVWARAEGPLEARGEAAARLARIDADVTAFDEAVRSLVAELAPEHAGWPTPAAARDLGDRLARARELARDAVALDTAVGEMRDAEAAARNQLSSAKAAIAGLAARAGVAEGTDLAAVVAAARERHRLARRLEEERGHLVAQAGSSEAAARADVAGARREDLEASREDIRRALPEVDHAVEEATRAHQSAIARREELARLDGAESARQAEENALARLVEIADDWRVLNAAERILGATVEEFRRRHQSPVLSSAAALFSIVTLGRYPQLASDFDDQGQPVLAVVRDDGRRLRVEALSEGTRDQLFLSLRLATLLDHAERSEALPFIGDDLFMSFDEERTAAGLSALATFGERVQAILFTHHAHVADIARERLGERVDVCRL